MKYRELHQVYADAINENKALTTEDLEFQQKLLSAEKHLLKKFSPVLIVVLHLGVISI